MSIDARGLRNLAGVHPELVRIVRRVAETCPIPVTIIDGGGLRTQAQADDNAARGTGVKKSMHLPQSDGRSWAVDILPCAADGSPYWDELAARVITPHVFAAGDDIMCAVQNGADWDMDGIYGESGAAAKAGNEYDSHHYQLPMAAKFQAAGDAMQRRIAERHAVAERPELREGARGVDVALMQTRLGRIKADGHWGPATTRRLVAFQQLAQIHTIGVCGESTWRALVA